MCASPHVPRDAAIAVRDDSTRRSICPSIPSDHPRDHVARRLRRGPGLLRARHRGPSQPLPTARRDARATDGVERRGGRALRHHPDGGGPLGDAGARLHPVAVAFQPERRQVLLRMGHRLLGRSAGSHQPHDDLDPASQRPDVPDLALERHRRGLSLHAAGQGVHADRHEDRRGLAHGAPVASGARRHRRHELRRDHQAVPRRRRPLPAARWR
jgi:hypothetical protein